MQILLYYVPKAILGSEIDNTANNYKKKAGATGNKLCGFMSKLMKSSLDGAEEIIEQALNICNMG